MVTQSLKTIARQLQAEPDLDAFESLFVARLVDKRIKIPKAMEANFVEPELPAERRIKVAIEQFHAKQQTELQTELFVQKKREVDAERSLQLKYTKKGNDDVRIASKKVAAITARLQALDSRTLRPADSRIFPMVYAPVVVLEEGKLVIKPMRYHCRPNGSPESIDHKFAGLYNARRDTMNKSRSLWKPLFGHRHGVMVATSFFENVALHDFERRPLAPEEKPSNVVLHFNPQQDEPMLVACLWDLWQAPGHPDLLSFAAITDEPPEEVAATGHNRCIVPLKPDNVRAWLNPEACGITALDGLLEDRQRPYYQHALERAAA